MIGGFRARISLGLLPFTVLIILSYSYSIPEKVDTPSNIVNFIILLAEGSLGFRFAFYSVSNPLFR